MGAAAAAVTMAAAAMAVAAMAAAQGAPRGVQEASGAGCAAVAWAAKDGLEEVALAVWAVPADGLADSAEAATTTVAGAVEVVVVWQSARTIGRAGKWLRETAYMCVRVLGHRNSVLETALMRRRSQAILPVLPFAAPFLHRFWARSALAAI